MNEGPAPQHHPETCLKCDVPATRAWVETTIQMIGYITKKWVAFMVCPACDRLPCPSTQCRKAIVNPFATKCPFCGTAIKGADK